MRLLHYIQKQFQISRRQITKMIDNKHISINGSPIEAYTTEIKSGDIIKFNYQGKTIQKTIKITHQKPQILLFNKPIGYVVSKSDPHNKTIYELLPKQFQSFYYIGRLDKNSHGLVILTDEPRLVHEFEHPSKEIKKYYLVQLDNPLLPGDYDTLMQGIQDDGELLRMHHCKLPHEKKAPIRIVLTEGKKRHIRRMFAAVGYQIEDLQRIQEGPYMLHNIPRGKWDLIDYEE